MHLWTRTIGGLILTCIVLLGLQLVFRALSERGSILLWSLAGAFLAASVGAIVHDHRKGFFRAGRFGPASALTFVVWALGLLGSVVLLGRSTA